MEQIQEQVQWFINGLADLLNFLVDVCARMAQGIGSAFDMNISDAESRLVGLLLTTVVIYAFLRRLLKWDRKANQPQSITLKTSDTPAQVVAKDRDAFLGLVFRLALLLLGIAFLISIRS